MSTHNPNPPFSAQERGVAVYMINESKTVRMYCAVVDSARSTRTYERISNLSDPCGEAVSDVTSMTARRKVVVVDVMTYMRGLVKYS
jgi:predicted short-subunit dehydrogenase-like oxidoreductase (DUF2520 family)